MVARINFFTEYQRLSAELVDLVGVVVVVTGGATVGGSVVLLLEVLESSSPST